MIRSHLLSMGKAPKNGCWGVFHTPQHPFFGYLSNEMKHTHLFYIKHNGSGFHQSQVLVD
ncbi:MAG: hypothetical protein ACE5GO_09490 [Anaerolineales bacterium]